MTSKVADKKIEYHKNIPAGYRISAYILILEERICECCASIHKAPSPHLRVECINKKGYTQTLDLNTLSETYNDLKLMVRLEGRVPVLEHKIKTITTSVPLCQDCFQEISEKQKDFFNPHLPLTRHELARSIGIAEYLQETYNDKITMIEIEKEIEQRKKKKKEPIKTFSLLSLLSEDNPTKYKKG